VITHATGRVRNPNLLRDPNNPQPFAHRPHAMCSHLHKGPRRILLPGDVLTKKLLPQRGRQGGGESPPSGAVPSGVGWYYDDFTMHNAQRCSPEGQHIAYTRNAVPPLGVSATLDCQLACVMDTDCPAALVCGTTSGAKFCVDALCTEGEPLP